VTTESTGVCQPLGETGRCPLQRLAGRKNSFEKGGRFYVVGLVAPLPKFANQLSQRVVSITKFFSNFFLRSSIQKDGSQRFISPLLDILRMTKEPLTNDVDHDPCLPENVSRFLPPGRLNRTGLQPHPTIRNSPKPSQTLHFPDLHRKHLRNLPVTVAAPQSKNELTLRIKGSLKTLGFQRFCTKNVSSQRPAEIGV